MARAIVTGEDVLNACRDALRQAPKKFPPDLPVNRLSRQPEWYPFEHSVWETGEHIRHAFLKTRSLRKQTEILDAIVKCALARNLRRGRQSFVMLLGHVAAQPYADAIAPLCADPDVAGHAIDTLIKMRAPGYARHVRPLLSAQHAWIRNKARTYLERYGASAA